jgi:hypothetical protein
MLQLATLPTLAGLTDEAEDSDGSGFDFQAFLDSSTGQNLTANILNMASKQTGTTPIFKNPSGTFATAAKSIDPLWIIGGVVALGLVLYMAKK